MADDPFALASEAKTRAHDLKEMLKARDPWDKEVEFQRRNLQKQYLNLLLVHPHAKESKDVENVLWMYTSHALIGPYKTRIADIEKSLRQASTQKQQGKRQQHGPVEHRKLVHRYRQYLAGEEKFWTQLIARLHEQFSLREADAILASLGITTDDAQGSRLGHFQFPAPLEGSIPPSDPTERAGRIAILAKALVCLGDLARYRELAAEAGPRRPDDTTKRGGRSNRGKQVAVSVDAAPKALDKARALYEAARSLAPDDGNPPHQLAILALHKRDSFEGVVQNYRALCARQPYVTAAGNLASILRGALKEYKNALSTVDGSGPRRATVETFKKDVVALHASCRTGEDAELAQRLGTDAPSDFASLISERLLPVDIITKVLTLAQGSLWYMTRDQATREYLDIAPSLVLATLLSLYRVLFDIGTRELQESTTLDAHDLAMRITAVLRRMLPALRIAGKWLRVKHNLDLVFASSSTTTQTFWKSYFAFFTQIAAVFPPDQLPHLRRPLEEDVELVGYMPLGALLVSRTHPEVIASEDRRALEEVHPNEEQLMRIWDIWHDAALIAKLAPAQMRSFRAHAASRRPSKAQTPVSTTLPRSYPVAVSDATGRYPILPTTSSIDDDARTETTDPVGDAFRQALGEDVDSDEEEILFNPRDSIMSIAPEVPTSTHHTLTKQTPRHPSSSDNLFFDQPTPPAGAITPPGTSATGPTPFLASSTHSAAHRTSLSSSAPAVPHTPNTTAQDLLANVLGHGAPSRAPRRASQASHYTPAHNSTESSAEPRTAPLLANNSPGAALGTGHSIWSTSSHEPTMGAHHRRLSHPSLQGAANMRIVSQPPPWAGTPERFPGQQSLYNPTPPLPVHGSVPPVATFPTSLQQSTSQASLGAPPPSVQAHRRLPSANSSSLLAQHSYLPPPSAQPAMYASPSHPQIAPSGPALLRTMDNLYLGGAQPRSAQTDLRDVRGYRGGAIGEISKGGVTYVGGLPPADGLQQAGLGLAGGIWGPAG